MRIDVAVVALKIPLWAYCLALIGLLPGTIMLCFVGASASSLTDTSATGNKTMNIITVVSGVLFAGIGVYVASYYSKLELEKVCTCNLDCFLPVLVSSCGVPQMFCTCRRFLKLTEEPAISP